MGNSLTQQEKEQLRQLPPDKAKAWLRELFKAYNKLCKQCKLKVMRNSRRPIEDYCDECRPFLESTLEVLK